MTLSFGSSHTRNLKTYYGIDIATARRIIETLTRSVAQLERPNLDSLRLRDDSFLQLVTRSRAGWDLCKNRLRLRDDCDWQLVAHSHNLIT